jgi:hypothetical protein
MTVFFDDKLQAYCTVRNVLKIERINFINEAIALLKLKI